MKNLFLYSSFLFLSLSVSYALEITQGDVGIVELPQNCKDTHIYINKLGTFPVFNFQNKKLLAIPSDNHTATGTFKINGCKGGIFEKEITISELKKEKENFVIPKEQGGDTKINATKIKTSILNDSLIFLKAWTNKKQIWSENFIWPIKNVKIVDSYGYIRDSKGVNVTHKGTDFEAQVDTSVYAMNRGVVRYVGNLPTYGRVIIVDHGKGVQSVYLHLSKILVSTGQLVLKNDLIAKSGNTGFVTGPHLHLSIRMSGMSVNPESFMKLFGEK